MINIKPIKEIIDESLKKSKKTIKDRILRQMDLIFGIDEKGVLQTLRDLIKLDKLSFPSLTLDQQASITAERINAQDEFKIHQIIEGKEVIIDKDAAMKAIKDKTDLGKRLIRIEMNAIKSIFKKVMEQKDKWSV